jgi:hypothetical protein
MYYNIGTKTDTEVTQCLPWKQQALKLAKIFC